MGEYSELTKDQLQDILRDRDLPVSGNKDELEQRLEQADADKGDEPVDTAADVEVDAPSAEDQAEQAAEVADEAGISDLYEKEAVLPQNVQPSGGVIPPVNEQVGPPLTEDQLRQLAEAQAAIEAVADAAGWEQDEKADPEDEGDAQVSEQPEVPQAEPVPTEALAERKAQNRADGEGPLPGSAEERQRDGATEESARQPLLQRPSQEQGGHATHQETVTQTGDTLPGERSLENDAPAFQETSNHVPGTPLPDEYYETAGPAPQPALHEKVDTDAVAAEKEDE